MKATALVLVVAAFGCDLEDDPETAEVEAASTPVTGQGTSYQGTSYQGTSYQGTSYQGTSYQGTSYQGATYGGTTLPANASVSGTALVVWRQLKNKLWEQRLPNRICIWDRTRATLQSCNTVNLATTPSPLVGVGFQGTFRRTNGTTFTGTITIDAVRADTSAAMHRLQGASSCPLVAYGATDATGATCDNPHGCRVNCDVWLYDLALDDGGASIEFCPNGVPATALAGVYSATGQRTASKTRFTFACTNGTVAKCTRWGYRSWGSARKYCDAPGCGSDYTLYPLADYHQACVRAAAADYCANGHSFTRNGTLVDIWDYTGAKYDFGLIPSVRHRNSTQTTFVMESGFDKLGAHQIDHLRFAELEGSPSYGSIDDPALGCPDRFIPGDAGDVTPTYVRDSKYGAWATPTVWVDSAPSCSHSELTVGKWLHTQCSACTRKVPAYCTDPTDARGWDTNCVAKAQALCTDSQRMAAHGECTAGAGLSMYDSGCTLAVCLDPAYASCCNASSSTAWTSACVSAASAKCKTAKHGGNTLLGFCSAIVSPPVVVTF